MRLLTKIISLLFFPLSLCGYIITPIGGDELYITSEKFGPFFAHQKDYELTVVVHSTAKRRRFNSELFCGRSPEDILYHKDYGQNITDGYVCELTYILPTRDYLSEDGLYCRISLYNSELDIYNNTYSFTIYPINKNKSINANNYKNKSFEVENIAYEFTSMGVVNQKEVISFPDYKSYLDIDVYHKLTLDSVKIETNQKDITYQEAYLRFFDHERLFPYIGHKDNAVTIPLTLVKKDNYWTFAYKNKMYVHPKTCQMSLNPRDGFVLTNNFYLPANQKAKVLENKFMVHIESFGVGLTDINWFLEYIAQLNLIGDCDDSEYCVVGEQI